MSRTQADRVHRLRRKRGEVESHGTSMPLEFGPRPRNAYRLPNLKEVRRIHKVPFAEYTTVLTPQTLREIFAILHSSRFEARATGHSWLFRGQADEKWGLQSSLERVLPRPDLNFPDVGWGETVEQVRLLWEFQRRAHHFITDLPDKDDDLEWLALMQHYGAPTRLLDCTLSPYVATFFASSAGISGRASAVWAFHLPTLRGQAYRTVRTEDSKLALFNPSDREHFRKVLLAAPLEYQSHPFVFPVEPFRMNERLTAQQGRFLCPRALRFGFETNLKVALADAVARPNLPRQPLYKIIIPAAARLGLLEELDKMNINVATLFPGLEGFARSLQTQIELGFSRGARFRMMSTAT